MGNGNSSVSPALLEEKHVVIIGGGYGGIALASTLQKIRFHLLLLIQKIVFITMWLPAELEFFQVGKKIVQEYYTYFILGYILGIFRPFRISKYFWLMVFSLLLGKKCHHKQFFLQ